MDGGEGGRQEGTEALNGVTRSWSVFVSGGDGVGTRAVTPRPGCRPSIPGARSRSETSQGFPHHGCFPLLQTQLPNGVFHHWGQVPAGRCGARPEQARGAVQRQEGRSHLPTFQSVPRGGGTLSSGGVQPGAGSLGSPECGGLGRAPAQWEMGPADSSPQSMVSSLFPQALGQGEIPSGSV